MVPALACARGQGGVNWLGSEELLDDTPVPVPATMGTPRDPHQHSSRNAARLQHTAQSLSKSKSRTLYDRTRTPDDSRAGAYLAGRGSTKNVLQNTATLQEKKSKTSSAQTYWERNSINGVAKKASSKNEEGARQQQVCVTPRARAKSLTKGRLGGLARGAAAHRRRATTSRPPRPPTRLLPDRRGRRRLVLGVAGDPRHAPAACEYLTVN